MLIESVMAFLLLACLLCFISVNLHNILIVHRRVGPVKVYAEVERPSGFAVNIAAIGTFIYFLETLAYLSLVFAGLISWLCDLPLSFRFSSTLFMQILGSIVTIGGYSLFIWSIIVRGQYATSWKMSQNHRLITRGPYRYVRHPSYLGYFLMFFGLLFIWSNLFTLFPLLAIPGYVKVVSREEELLAKRFGDEYLDYQKRTGRFIPRRR
jgi:protein-S-isoprenylcysteine O-methyltransferase Ste14